MSYASHTASGDAASASAAALARFTVAIASLEDDEPLLRPSSEADSDSSDSSQADESILLRGKPNVWTHAFVLAYHNHFYDESVEDICPWRFSEIVADKEDKKKFASLAKHSKSHDD